jgi:hypothetical protein
MLTITIPKSRLWDTKEEAFINIKEQTLSLEHSLVSISKWEAKWHKPFISDEKKTQEQTLDYIKYMTLTQNVDNNVYNALTKENFEEITAYIENKMTATWFSEPKNTPQVPGKKEIITSELIYYWMIALEIPFECQKWHLNRLLTLIKVCNAKAKAANGKKSSVNKREILANNAELNAARRKKLGTSG